jgi:hypothetical protein
MHYQIPKLYKVWGGGESRKEFIYLINTNYVCPEIVDDDGNEGKRFQSLKHETRIWQEKSNIHSVHAYAHPVQRCNS